MAEGELNLALATLRVVRGWTQDELSKESGIPDSSISDYERGKKVPSLKSLERLTAAMGFSIQSVQRTQRFIVAVRSESLLSDLQMEELPMQSPGFDPDAEPAVFGSASPAALQWEVDQIAVEAGRAVSRLTRTMLVLLARAGGPVGE